MSIPHLYTDPYAYKIEQMDDRVILSYEKDDVVRTVWLEGHGHERPALNQFFVHGYATGRYEGSEAVLLDVLGLGRIRARCARGRPCRGGLTKGNSRFKASRTPLVAKA